MKATIDKAVKRRTTTFGLPAGHKKKTQLSGELIDHRCSKCGDSVLTPADATRVTCGTCMLKIAHNHEQGVKLETRRAKQRTKEKTTV